MERIFSVIQRLLGFRRNQHQGNFKFANLAAELRCMIYKEVMPEGFCHYYAIDPDFTHRTMLLWRDCPPELFRAAKWILFEAVQSTIGETTEIEVSWKGICTNFPLEAPFLGRVRHVLDPEARTVDDCTIQLPRCKRIRVKILLPPRELSLYMRTRRNVTKVVEWLNRGDPKQSPALEVEFISPGIRVVVWNEVPILAGPLSRLTRRYAPATIARNIGYISDDRFKEHCDILEGFLNRNGEDSERVLEYQQAMLDVRLTVTYLTRRITMMRRLRRDNNCKHPFPLPGENSDPIDEATIDHLVTGLTRLQDWCEKYEVNPPRWLYSLRWTIETGELITTDNENLLCKVLCRGWVREYESWAIGRSTYFNPLDL